MTKKSIYADVDTLVLKRPERVHPFFIGLNPRPDWDEVYYYWSKFLKYMKRHSIKTGRHDEIVLKKWDKDGKMSEKP